MAGSTEGMAASTVSGRLLVKGVKTRTLELATISGDLVLVNIACDRAQVRTVSGATEFGGPLVKVGRYEFTSHSGDVRLTLSGAQGFELAAKTFSGGVHSDLPLTLGQNRFQPPAWRARTTGPSRHLWRRRRAGDREDLQRFSGHRARRRRASGTAGEA